MSLLLSGLIIISHWESVLDYIWLCLSKKKKGIRLHQSFRDNKDINNTVSQGAIESWSKAWYCVIAPLKKMKHANKNRRYLLTACVMGHVIETFVTIHSHSGKHPHPVSFHILFIPLLWAKIYPSPSYQSYLLCFFSFFESVETVWQI